MVTERQKSEKGEIGYKTHAFDGRLIIVGFRSFLRDQQVYQERPEISNEHTGCSMKTISLCETIERKSEEESQYHHGFPPHFERQPQYEEIIQVRANEVVERWNIV